MSQPIFKGTYNSPSDTTGGKSPVIFDILGPDEETSILPEGWRLVLHVNPNSMAVKYAKRVERMQTKSGFVEQHWGDDPETINFDMATGGFMRLYSGLSNVTEPGYTGGTRRETLAYDRYLDMLALFHNNGSVYDLSGQVALQGIVKITFDDGVYFGWFGSFTVTESSDKPYSFALTTDFTVDREIMNWRTTV